MRIRGIHDERGATAVLIAASLFMLMGFAALAVDIGIGMNERRQDQSAADSGALAAAVEARLLGSPAEAVEEALDYVEENLDKTYTQAEWEALWLGCTDPEKDQAPLNVYNFQPQPTPTSWTSVGVLDCVSISGGGYFRVKVPEQIVETTFARVLGINQIAVDASAISRLSQEGIGGILPFGLASDVNEGDHTCLSDAPTGLAEDPCDGSDSGNFGTLKGRMFGTPDESNPGSYLIPPNCNASPLSDVLAINISAGLDHWVTLDGDGNPANEVRDVCFNSGVDTLNTDTGFPNNGAEQGLATGPISFNLEPRLQQGPAGDRTNRFGYPLNNKPLWQYLLSNLQDADPSNDPPGVPDSCGGFTNLTEDVYDWNGNGLTTDSPQIDWNNDGVLDDPESWEHMAACLNDYVAPPASTTVIFEQNIEVSPRFAYVPQFWEPDLGTGSDWLHVRRFKAIYLQATIWQRSAVDRKVFHPGEACSPCSSTAYSMMQLTAFVIPDASLPEGLRGDPPPGEVGGPYKGVELWK